MARGAAAAGGSFYYADLVWTRLRESGFDTTAGQAGLDFGCSSARVVQGARSGCPELDWHESTRSRMRSNGHVQTCPGSLRAQPRVPAASVHGHRTSTSCSPISIWSHFAEGAALDLAARDAPHHQTGWPTRITTHGTQTIVHTQREGVRSLEQLSEVRDSLVEDGFWYAAEFGEQGDDGVANPDWGTAFVSPEWLLAKLTPDWHVEPSSGPDASRATRTCTCSSGR